MKFLYFLAALLPGFSFCALAQTDTAVRNNVLKEVVIINHKDEHTGPFSFYRSGKFSTTEDILAKMPGVNMIKRGAYGLEPALRIYSSGQINVTIDGMKLYGACTDKMDPVSIYIEPNNLDEISVIHGASGSSMGSTIGGGLNMTLKKPSFSHKKMIVASISQSYSTINNGINTSLFLNTSSRRFSSNLGFVFRKAYNYRDGNGKTVSFSQYEKMNWSTNLSYKVNAKNVFSLQYLGDKGTNIGFPALSMDVGTAIAHIASFSHQFSKPNGLLKNSESKLYYNNVYHSMDDTKRPAVPIHMDMPGWSETWGAYHQDLIRWNKHELSTRIDGHYAYTRADMIMYPLNESIMYMQTLPSNNLYNAGAFVQYIYQLDSLQSIRSSIRFDYYSQYANSTIGAKQWEVMNQDITRSIHNFLKNGSLSYSRKFKKKIETTLTAAYGERLPTTNERYGYYLYIRMDGFDYLGNPDLKPESAWQGELKVKVDIGKIQPSVNLFYHHIENYIYPFVYPRYTSMTIGARGVKGYSNLKSANLQGLEAAVSYLPARKVFYMATVRYTYATASNGTPVAQVPPLKIQHALRYEHRLFQLQAEYDWAATQQRINPESAERPTSSWHVVNIRLARKIQFSRSVIQLSTSCENIFDTWYREHLDWGNIGRPGRNFVFTITFAFR